MSSKPPNKPKNGFSRRGFIRGVGLSSGAVGAGVLETVALTESAAAATSMGPAAVPITLKINGKPTNLTVEPRVTLLDALRNYIGMTGAKRVCDRGTCGACTVIVNGKVIYSCTTLAIDAQGKDIQTIEGIAPAGKLHAVSAAFVNNDGQQCGYCTPGMILAAVHLLEKKPQPALTDIREGLAGNLCRCTGYMQIFEAVAKAARQRVAQ